MTYKDIRREVWKTTHRRIHHPCWIAEVKRKHGLTRGPAHNSGKGKGAPPCPDWAFRAIEDALRQNGII